MVGTVDSLGVACTGAQVSQTAMLQVLVQTMAAVFMDKHHHIVIVNNVPLLKLVSVLVLFIFISQKRKIT
jgi:hypothetical protein